MHGGEDSMVGDFLAGWVNLASKNALVVVITVLFITAVLLTYTINNLGVNTDTTDMIAEELEWRQRFIDYRDTFPGQVRNLIVVIESETPELVDRTRDSLIQALTTQSDIFHDIYSPGAGEFFAQNGLLFLPVDDLDRMADNLAAGQPFMARLSADPSAAALFAMIGDAAEAKQNSNVEFNVAPVLKGIAEGFDAAGKHYHRMSWRRFLAGNIETPQVYRQFIVTRPLENFRGLAPGRQAMDAKREHISGARREYKNPDRESAT